MIKKVKQYYNLFAAAKHQGSSMQRKLVLYWICMVLALFAGFMLVLSLAGVFSYSESKIEETIKLQQQNNVGAVTGQLDILKSSCVKLSEKASREVESVLTKHNISFKQLNDSPALLSEIQEKLYNALNTTMQIGHCSGAFVVLDATTNTQAKNAESSRSSVWLRAVNISSAKQALQDITYFRGIPDIARSQNILLHNRWNLEFDTSAMPGYQKLMNKKIVRLADSCFLSDKLPMKDTWEDAMLLCVPILDSSGNVCGICGVEISELYFRLSYPGISSSYGKMITVFAPQTTDGILLSAGMFGNAKNAWISANETMKGKTGKHYNTYYIADQTYIGLQTAIDIHCLGSSAGDTKKEMQLVTLLPFSSVHDVAIIERSMWIAFSLVFPIAMIILAFFLSKRFASPIISSLKTMQSENAPEWRRSGISEIDELMQFMRENKDKKIYRSDVPESIMDIFNQFVERVHTLTDAEYGVFKYYVDGYQIQEIPELAFISMPTVRKHNRNIYDKLDVSSKDEMMLYIDLLRKCGKIGEIILK